MVNRRVLRIKTIKNLYSYDSCQQANLELAMERIHQDFAHDLNSMEPYDAQDKKSKKDEAIQYLKKVLMDDTEEGKSLQVTEESKDSAINALNFFNEQNQTDYNKIKKDLQKDFDRIRESQVLVWKLLKEFANQNRRLVLAKSSMSEKFGQKSSEAMPLYNNKVLAKILEAEEVQEQLIREKVSWSNDEDKVRGWYKNILRRHPFFDSYLKKDHPDEEEDYMAVDEIIRKLIFKTEAIETFFEERDINWNENKQIVRSLVLKTLKSLKDKEITIVFPPLSYNWEEDLEYYLDLFANTIRNNDYYESLIEKKVKNWKLDRLAAIDKVILKTAICEMVRFQSIPVKVTINEFIEISKIYSTPKSKKFINGLLDAISEDLINSGEIRKSGRGLIDSK